MGPCCEVLPIHAHSSFDFGVKHDQDILQCDSPEKRLELKQQI